MEAQSQCVDEQERFAKGIATIFAWLLALFGVVLAAISLATGIPDFFFVFLPGARAAGGGGLDLWARGSEHWRRATRDHHRGDPLFSLAPEPPLQPPGRPIEPYRLFYKMPELGTTING